jgi:hypothetical protein
MNEEELLWGSSGEVEQELEELRRNHPGWSARVFLLYALDQYRELDYARRRNQPDAMADVCTPSCLESLRHSDRPMNIPVEVKGAQIVATGVEGDYDTIDVKFFGERLDADGVGPGETIDYLRLSRYRFEHSSDSETGLTESCGRCGGAIDPTTDWKCRFCDQLVNEQSSGWQIEKVMDQGDYVR